MYAFVILGLRMEGERGTLEQIEGIISKEQEFCIHLGQQGEELSSAFIPFLLG